MYKLDRSLRNTIGSSLTSLKEPEPSDPLLESLRDRMEELYEDDDEDDGDGDVPAKLLPRN